MRDWLNSRAKARAGSHAYAPFRGGAQAPRMNAGVARVRDAFRVEPLEPRVLLSADPVFSPLAALFLPEERELQDKLSAAEQQASGQTPMSSPDAMLGMLASVPTSAVDLQANAVTQAVLALPQSGQGSLVLDAGDAAAGLSVAFSAPVQEQWQPQTSPGELSATYARGDGQGLTVSWGQASADGLMPEWPLDLQAAADPQWQPPRLEQVERLSGQSFDLAQLPALEAGTDLWVGADAALKGSGAFYGDLTVEGLLSPGYSPGVQNVGTLTLGAGSTILFEIGGATAGTGSNFHDQINVSGLATLNGQIQVDLLPGFIPTDGQVFNVLTYSSVSGGFASGSGLIDAGQGVFFEVLTASNGLSLKAHVLDASTAKLVNALRSAVAADDQALQDRVGQWLNFDYFRNNSSYSFNGSIALGEGFSLSGSATIGFTNNVVIAGQTVDVFTLGLENASGHLGLNANSNSVPGLRFTDADLGVLWLRSENVANDGGWLWAEGTVAGLTMVGGSSISLTASSLTLDFAQGLGTVGAAANNTMLDLSAAARSLVVGSTTYTFDSATTPERAAVSWRAW